MTQNDKKKVPLCIWGTIPHMIVVFGFWCKMVISPAIFFSFFQNSDFSGFSKFINKCQKKIWGVPHLLHMCVVLEILEIFDVFLCMHIFAIWAFWLILDVLTFAKFVEFVKRSTVRGGRYFLIFQPKDMLN